MISVTVVAIAIKFCLCLRLFCLWSPNRNAIQGYPDPEKNYGVYGPLWTSGFTPGSPWRCWDPQDPWGPRVSERSMGASSFFSLNPFSEFPSDFCESNLTESRDREWELRGKFLRVEIENEISQANFWELRMRMKVFFEKLRVEIENETLKFSRMRVPCWESRFQSGILMFL